MHGGGGLIKTFAERVVSQKGVESVKLTTIQVEEKYGQRHDFPDYQVFLTFYHLL